MNKGIYTFAVTNNKNPKTTVSRVFQSFLGQTLTINLLTIVQSVLRCSAAVGSSFDLAFSLRNVEDEEVEVAEEEAGRSD